MAQLSYLDLVSAITAAACHDFAHDGFTNIYHVNFMTKRALRCNDMAVQENWHASQSLKILLKQENNFVENFSESEKKVLRKRVIGMILATDMADHNKHVALFGRQIKHKNISKEQGNGSEFIDNTRLFETQ